MKILITGGAGFLGSNLAQHALENGHELIVLDNLLRKGSEKNLEWLKASGNFVYYSDDVRSEERVSEVIRTHQPDVIYHLAGQVAMTTSIENPRMDFEINVLGTLNVLEAVRQCSPHSIVAYSSTNKVFGDLEWARFEENEKRYSAPDFPNGFNEKTPLDFHSPYGCSKGAADQYCLDYSRIFGLKTIVFRHSSIFGLRQFSTFDQGWIGWFVEQALRQKQSPQAEEFTISGNGKQVRDVLFSEDLVRCYFKAVENIDHPKHPTKGNAFNIGGGMSNSLSLLELFDFLEDTLSMKLRYRKLPWRESDQKIFVADTSKSKEYFGWQPEISRNDGLKKMLEWVKSNESNG